MPRAGGMCSPISCRLSRQEPGLRSDLAGSLNISSKLDQRAIAAPPCLGRLTSGRRSRGCRYDGSLTFRSTDRPSPGPQSRDAPGFLAAHLSARSDERLGESLVSTPRLQGRECGIASTGTPAARSFEVGGRDDSARRAGATETLDQLGAIAHSDLVHDRCDVAANRRLRQVQLLRDLGRRVPLAEAVEDLPLTTRERRGRPPLRSNAEAARRP